MILFVYKYFESYELMPIVFLGSIASKLSAKGTTAFLSSAFYWNESICVMTSASRLGGPDLSPIKVHVDASYNDSQFNIQLYFKARTNPRRSRVRIS